MNTNMQSPGGILSISSSYWQGCVLHTAVFLDIFTVIGSQTKSASDIADNSDLNPRAMEMLLNALVSMSLLVKSDEGYLNTEASSTFLDQSSDRYIGYLISHHYDLMKSWIRLPDAIATGKPVRGRSTALPSESRENFCMGMFNTGMGTAPGLTKAVDIGNRSRLLDMGGGPGTYAIFFCKANPQLKATVFDLPTSKPFFQKTIDRFNLNDRIDFIGGNYLTDEIPGSYDVVFMSHILHSEGPKSCQRMVQHAAAILNPGGLLIIHEFILNNDKNGPLFPALFSLNMLLGTDQGQSYSEQELSAMLAQSGLINIRRHSFCGPNDSGVIIGEKK